MPRSTFTGFNGSENWSMTRAFTGTALVVDALAGQQDIVVEPFDAPTGMPPFVGGATILADGAPALILDAAALL